MVVVKSITSLVVTPQLICHFQKIANRTKLNTSGHRKSDHTNEISGMDVPRASKRSSSTFLRESAHVSSKKVKAEKSASIEENGDLDSQAYHGIDRIAFTPGTRLPRPCADRHITFLVNERIDALYRSGRRVLGQPIYL